MNTQIKSKVSEMEILIKDIRTIARLSNDAHLNVIVGSGILDIQCGIEKIYHILKEE